LRRPDFFIVGAPKSGTTALYENLRRHPEIFMPELKEPHFFGTDLKSPDFIRDERAYLSLFDGARGARRAGEASVWYLYSERAAAEIKEFEPSARIIIMLRNPVEMIHSLHAQRLYSGNEELESFEAALEAEAERKKGLRLPPRAYPVEGLFYREVAKYSAQVRRYLSAFEREQVHVILFDDLRQSPPRVYREACEFLGVGARLPEQDARAINPNKRARSKTLRNLLRHPPPLVRAATKALMPLPLRERVRKGLKGLNTKYEQRRPMSAQCRERLRAELAPDVERLSELLGRDLTHWLGADPAHVRGGETPPKGVAAPATRR